MSMYIDRRHVPRHSPLIVSYWTQAWREDRTLVAASECIADALGQKYVDSVPLSMEMIWAESSPKTPVICLLSPGDNHLNDI